MLAGLAMIARWTWRRHWRFITWSVVWLMMLTFILFIFLVLQSQKPTESVRPYFTKSRTSIYNIAANAKSKVSNWILTVSVQNNDKPARNVINQLLILDNRLDPTIKPLRTRRTRNANDVGRFQNLSHHEPVAVGANTRSAFVVFEIKYTDASNNESYSQIWFMKFAGSRGGKFVPTLFESTQNERSKIEAYIRQQNIPMLTVRENE